mgnify:FL=1
MWMVPRVFLINSLLTFNWRVRMGLSKWRGLNLRSQFYDVMLWCKPPGQHLERESVWEEGGERERDDRQ